MSSVPKESKLTEMIDKVEIDIKSDLTDWHAVKKELYSKRWRRIVNKTCR